VKKDFEGISSIVRSNVQTNCFIPISELISTNILTRTLSAINIDIYNHIETGIFFPLYGNALTRFIDQYKEN